MIMIMITIIMIMITMMKIITMIIISIIMIITVIINIITIIMNTIYIIITNNYNCKGGKSCQRLQTRKFRASKLMSVSCATQNTCTRMTVNFIILLLFVISA